jgi:hypothetical protein
MIGAADKFILSVLKDAKAAKSHEERELLWAEASLTLNTDNQPPIPTGEPDPLYA